VTKVIATIALGAASLGLAALPAAAARPWPGTEVRSKLEAAFARRGLKYCTDRTGNISYLPSYERDDVSVFSQADWAQPECPLDVYRRDPYSKAGSDAFDVAEGKEASLDVEWFSSPSLLRKAASHEKRSNKDALYVWQWKPTIIRLHENTRPEMIAAVRQVMRDLHAKVVRDNFSPRGK
jgi:hypothetical protein